VLTPAGAVATDGVFTVTMTCHLSSTCEGAVLVCVVEDPPGGTLCDHLPFDYEETKGGQVAASDFIIPSEATMDVPVALTEVGKYLAGQPDGHGGRLLVNLQDYGNVQTGPTCVVGAKCEVSLFHLSSTDDPPPLPAGARSGCGGLVFAGPNTSCSFAHNVRKSYKPQNSVGPIVDADVTASSQATGETYTLHCTGATPHVCKGDAGATVYFF